MPQPNKIRLSQNELVSARRILTALVNRSPAVGEFEDSKLPVDISLQYARSHERFRARARALSVSLMLHASFYRAAAISARRYAILASSQWRKEVPSRASSKRLHFFNHGTVEAHVESAIDTCPRRSRCTVPARTKEYFSAGDTPELLHPLPRGKCT